MDQPKSQYSILSVDRQINAEAKRLIHNQSFQIPICEGSGIVESSQAETSELMEEPSWSPAYPELDDSQVRELTINIIPSSWPCYRDRARFASVFLSNKRLLPSSPLKIVRIVLSDTVNSLGWGLLTQWSYPDFRCSPRPSHPGGS